MKATAHLFKQNAAAALRNRDLQDALAKARDGFVGKRALAVAEFSEFEALKNTARKIKDQTLAHLDEYLEEFETQVTAAGGNLHWAETAAEACQAVVGICHRARAKRITKGKTMVGEEIELNTALQMAGFKVVETDLGEYIIQLADEPPSHIIAPAVHKTRAEIGSLFHQHHEKYGLQAPLNSVASIVDEAREVLRSQFVAADVGITGANFLVAETGSVVLVTNEGNGDLTASLPRVHVVVTGIEKMIPSLDDASLMLRLLGRSATGQEITAYTSWFTGPQRPGDPDGPEEWHVVLVDNGRSDMRTGPFREMLRCIRCGACLNHCPVYAAVGGHAYGWVYPGPMGSVLTPLMTGLSEAHTLADASTLCGRCEQICPMSIPLPRLLREHRNQAHASAVSPLSGRLLLAGWAFLARRPGWYRRFADMGVKILARLARHKGRLCRLPLASAWTNSRDLPAPAQKSFLSSCMQRQDRK